MQEPMAFKFRTSATYSDPITDVTPNPALQLTVTGVLRSPASAAERDRCASAPMAPEGRSPQDVVVAWDRANAGAVRAPRKARWLNRPALVGLETRRSFESRR